MTSGIGGRNEGRHHYRYYQDYHFRYPRRHGQLRIARRWLLSECSSLACAAQQPQASRSSPLAALPSAGTFSHDSISWQHLDTHKLTLHTDLPPPKPAPRKTPPRSSASSASSAPSRPISPSTGPKSPGTPRPSTASPASHFQAPCTSSASRTSLRRTQDGTSRPLPWLRLLRRGL